MISLSKSALMSLEKETNNLFYILFPLCRSITGKGILKTLSILQGVTPFQIHSIPSGTKCYDWNVPDEWYIKDGYIKDFRGKRLVDFRKNNLSVVSYSTPIKQLIPLHQLAPHLHSLPKIPEAIPYRTSYYKRDWGFCLTHKQKSLLNPKERYRVVIDSKLFPGNLTYGEQLIKGSSNLEFLISTYCCHPSLGNDNLSGVVLWTLLLKLLSFRPTHHSYRFIIIPETIGAIAYLHINQQNMKRIQGGFVITCVAGPGQLGYKETFLKNHPIDMIVKKTFANRGRDYYRYPFTPIGSDERQFSSPYFRIPMGTICKDKYYEYIEYHTSLDNLNFIKPHYLLDTLMVYLEAIELLESTSEAALKLLSLKAISQFQKQKKANSPVFRSLNPWCEPQLGKRGLYPAIGGSLFQKAIRPLVDEKFLTAMRWVLFFGDGKTPLTAIAEKSGFSQNLLEKAASMLCTKNLLEPVKPL